jgi:hypothetical protein
MKGENELKGVRRMKGVEDTISNLQLDLSRKVERGIHPLRTRLKWSVSSWKPFVLFAHTHAHASACFQISTGLPFKL